MSSILKQYLNMLNDKSVKNKEDIIMSMGLLLEKNIDEKDIETLLFNISQLKRCDKETFQQILFVIDIINNERINNLVTEISLLANK